MCDFSLKTKTLLLLLVAGKEKSVAEKEMFAGWRMMEVMMTRALVPRMMPMPTRTYFLGLHGALACLLLLLSMVSLSS